MYIGMCMLSYGNGTGVTSSLIALIANAGQEDQAVATACKLHDSHVVVSLMI